MFRESFIDDGYTEDGFIDAVPRLFDKPLRFKFRPCLPEQKAKIVAKLRVAKADESERIHAVALAETVTEWDLVNKAGDAQPLKAQSFLRLKPFLLSRLADIVIYGVEGGDVDPNWPTDKKKDHDETAGLSVLTGEVFADQRDGDNEKN